MARVNVDQKALSDPRFEVLARLMGYSDPDIALGRMVRVWNACQEMETHFLSFTVLEAIFGHPDAHIWLVDADLASRQNDTGDMRKTDVNCRVKRGFVRIKGTAGRIEWLANRRRDGRLGGRPPRNPRDLPPDNPRGRPSDNPPAPAPALDAKIPPNPPHPGGDVGFQPFWKAYPLKIARGKALRAWQRLNPDDATCAAIMAALERDRRRWQRETDIPRAATWLRDRRWEDQASSNGTVEKTPEQRREQARRQRSQAEQDGANVVDFGELARRLKGTLETHGDDPT